MDEEGKCLVLGIVGLASFALSGYHRCQNWEGDRNEQTRPGVRVKQNEILGVVKPFKIEDVVGYNCRFTP